VGGGTTHTGTGTDPTPGSAGIVVDNGGSPTLAMDTIEGGSGSTGAGEGNGSVGVYTTGANGAVTITGCTVKGGSGTTTGPSGTGSHGLFFTGATTSVDYTVTSSTITGGTGSNPSGCSIGCRATRGVYVDSGNAVVVLTGNAIDGGDEVADGNGSITGTDCPHGVEISAGGSAAVTGNRIYGGRCNIPNPASLASFFGLFVGGGASLVAENNMILMGTSNVPHSAAALGTANTTAPKIVHNTLIGGPNIGAPPTAALWLQTGTTGAVVQNNILADVGGSAAAVGLFLICATDAGPPVVTSFDANLVFATPAGLMDCNGGSSYATMDGMTAELNALSPGSAMGNFTLASSTTTCGTDSGCLPYAACTSQIGCVSSIFGGFDVASLGYANLFPPATFAGACPATPPPPGAGYGWPLAGNPPPPCPIARSMLNDSASITTDFYGNCRSTTLPSMGAAEYPPAGMCH
jgi:hypothetical protein